MFFLHDQSHDQGDGPSGNDAKDHRRVNAQCVAGSGAGSARSRGARRPRTPGGASGGGRVGTRARARAAEAAAASAVAIAGRATWGGRGSVRRTSSEGLERLQRARRVGGGTMKR